MGRSVERGQALIEMAIIMPVAILGVVVAINALLMIHTYSVVQDVTRLGLIMGMNHELKNATCDAACATQAVRAQMRRVGAQTGIQDANVMLGTNTCQDGMDTWLNPNTGWQPNQDFTVCVEKLFKPMGPFIPDNLTFTIRSELHGRRLP